jgi:predicted metal-dependent hydrolase
VTIPAWAPYKAGVDFARSRQAWITSQQKPLDLLDEGQPVGKAHRLTFKPSPSATNVSGRVSSGQVAVTYPNRFAFDSPEVQKAAHDGAIRALRAQAEQLLPQRLKTLAEQHGFKYNSVQIKRLKGRWGSCDHKAHIVLNLYLMQLPWELIDYVLLHELTHTKILRHGPDFWAAMKKVQPRTPELRKQIKQHHPVLGS